MGQGGAGCALRGPAATRGRGAYFVHSPRPAPVRGPTLLIPWTGPCFSPPKFYGGLSGAWVGRGISPRACVFWGPGGPVTNTNDFVDLLC